MRRRIRRIQSQKSPVEKGCFRLAQSDRVRNSLNSHFLRKNKSLRTRVVVVVLTLTRIIKSVVTGKVLACCSAAAVHVCLCAYGCTMCAWSVRKKSRIQQQHSSNTTAALLQCLPFVPVVAVYVRGVGAQQEIEHRPIFLRPIQQSNAYRGTRYRRTSHIVYQVSEAYSYSS